MIYVWDYHAGASFIPNKTNLSDKQSGGRYFYQPSFSDSWQLTIISVN